MEDFSITNVIRYNILDALGHNGRGSHYLFVLGKIVEQKEITSTIAIIKIVDYNPQNL